MTTAIASDVRHAAHTDAAHVERAERLWAVEAALAASGLLPSLSRFAPRLPTDAELTAVHSVKLVAALRRMAEMGGGRIDPDTYMTEGSWQAAIAAAGSALRAVEAVVGGEVQNAFALVRPPGHHATPTRAMGFCLINNIAVAARYATTTLGLQRVAIVDYDVHHGNGTQDVFYNDPRVLFCSLHSAQLYPFMGEAHEVGRDEGFGATLNIPLPYRVGDAGYQLVFDQLVAPALRRFQPELLLVSAGFDAHWADPLGSEALSVAGFAALTTRLRDLAEELCGGRLAVVLEGGYNLDALGACVVAVCDVLLGQSPRPDPLGRYNAREPDLTLLVEAVRRHHPLFQ